MLRGRGEGKVGRDLEIKVEGSIDFEREKGV
jgi:hypothetical protein